MASAELFVGSTVRVYFNLAHTLDDKGVSTEFTNSSGSLTVQVTELDGTAITSATAMTYASGAAVVNGTSYASGNWSLLLASTTAVTAGNQYLLKFVGTISGNSIPDLTKVVQVAAQYDGGT